jgi:hypothetical protein
VKWKTQTCWCVSKVPREISAFQTSTKVRKLTSNSSTFMRSSWSEQLSVLWTHLDTLLSAWTLSNRVCLWKKLYSQDLPNYRNEPSKRYSVAGERGKLRIMLWTLISFLRPMIINCFLSNVWLSRARFCGKICTQTEAFTLSKGFFFTSLASWWLPFSQHRL